MTTKNRLDYIKTQINEAFMEQNGIREEIIHIKGSSPPDSLRFTFMLIIKKCFNK